MIRLELALIAKLPQPAVEPLGLFPQLELLGPQSPSYPLVQSPEDRLAISDPEVVGESARDGIEVFYDLLQIHRGVSLSDASDLVLELLNLSRP